MPLSKAVVGEVVTTVAAALCSDGRMLRMTANLFKDTPLGFNYLFGPQ